MAQPTKQSSTSADHPIVDPFYLGTEHLGREITVFGRDVTNGPHTLAAKYGTRRSYTGFVESIHINRQRTRVVLSVATPYSFTMPRIVEIER